MICDKENQPDAWPYLRKEEEPLKKVKQTFEPKTDYHLIRGQQPQKKPSNSHEDNYLSLYDQIINL